ncbi:SURF1 family cytochrome oxidase biogenesis protein [Craterilacuibacter sp.]|uniref:SURF1 family cytochrome oxidase biogenesis protein n=1 Tax=Craterilacuibacter sp. TaxID=2870909 RepID=UPI003F37FC33
MKFAPGNISLKSSVIIGCCLLPFVLCAWQWQRGLARSAELAAYEAAALQAPQVLAEQGRAAQPDRRRVALSGRVVGDVLLWQGAGKNGRPDYRIWLPLALSDGSMVMVDVGRLAANTRLPLLPHTLTVNGHWQRWPQVLTLSGARLGDKGIVDAPLRAALAGRYGEALRPGVVVLESPLPGLAASPLKPAFDPQRHFAYALQWLLLGLLLLVSAWRLFKPANRAGGSLMEDSV